MKTHNSHVYCSFCGNPFLFAEIDEDDRGKTLAIRVGVQGDQVSLEGASKETIRKAKNAVISDADVGYRCSSCRNLREETTMTGQQLMGPIVYAEDITPESIAEYRKKLAVQVADGELTRMRSEFYK